MQVHLLKSKVHRARVAASGLGYEGSLTIASDLMDRVGFVPYERILFSNLADGQRFETSGIPGESGSGAIIRSGGTAHLGKVGDRATSMSFTAVAAARATGWQPRAIKLGEKNSVVNARGI